MKHLPLKVQLALDGSLLDQLILSLRKKLLEGLVLEGLLLDQLSCLVAVGWLHDWCYCVVLMVGMIV